MSLIDEALKRARMEAAQKAAEGEGLPYPTIPRHLAPRRRAGWLVPLVVALAVIAGVAVGLLLASRGGSTGEQVAEHPIASKSPGAAAPQTPIALAGTEQPAARRPTSPASAAPQPAAGEKAVTAPAESEQAARELVSPAISTLPPAGSGVESVAAAAAAQAPPTGDQPAATAPLTPPIAMSEPSSSPTSSSLPAADSELSATPAAPSPLTAPSATTTVTDPESGVLLVLPERPDTGVSDSVTDPLPDAEAEAYAQQYPLPGGGAIELGGIAWSETGPFALINGRVIGPGSVIEGYTVERIRPGHVVLTGDGRRIQLSLQ